MSLTGVYAYRDGALAKVSDKIPHRGTHPMANASFMEKAMWGYRRAEEKGQRILGSRRGIERIWNRAAGKPV